MNNIILNKNKNCICFIVDSIYLKHLSIVLESLNENCKKPNFDIVILENKLKDYEKSLLIQKYNNFKINLISASAYLNNKDLKEKNHITKTTYLRYVIFDILTNYEKVLYLDCDLLINTDINKFFLIDIDGYCLGGVRDTFHCFCNSDQNPLHVKENKYVKNELKLDNIFDYFNAGVILLNNKEIKKHNITCNFLFDVTLEKQFKWLDQDTLNYVFKGKIKFLDQGWNCMVGDKINFDTTAYKIIPSHIFENYKLAYKNPMIIHYAGKQQPVYNDKAAFSELYWKYAKNSLFYSELLNEHKKFKKINKIKRLIKKNKILYKLIKIFKK